jgi:hypothetical protein
MEQRPICLFRARKELSARASHNELTGVLGADAIADSRVPLYIRQRQFPTILVRPLDDSLKTIIDRTILEALENQPVSSNLGLASSLATQLWRSIDTSHNRLDLW